MIPARMKQITQWHTETTAYHTGQYCFFFLALLYVSVSCPVSYVNCRLFGAGFIFVFCVCTRASFSLTATRCYNDISNILLFCLVSQNVHESHWPGAEVAKMALNFTPASQISRALAKILVWALGLEKHLPPSDCPHHYRIWPLHNISCIYPF